MDPPDGRTRVGRILQRQRFRAAHPGVYRYAVASVYPDGSVSGLLPSGYLLNNAYADLTVPVATNSHSGDAAGAKVSVYDKDGSLAESGVAGSDGRVTFTDLWKGMYDVKVTMPGYHECVQKVDLTLEDAVTTEVMTLEEIIATPVNLKLFTQKDGSLKFTWNESGEISDGFEDYDVFGAPSNDGCNGSVSMPTVDAHSRKRTSCSPA